MYCHFFGCELYKLAPMAVNMHLRFYTHFHYFLCVAAVGWIVTPGSFNVKIWLFSSSEGREMFKKFAGHVKGAVVKAKMLLIIPSLFGPHC